MVIRMIKIDRDAKLLADFEKNNHLFDREYAGFHYWQYVRFQIFDSIYNNDRYNKEYQVKENRIRKLIIQARKAICNANELHRLNKCDLLCLAPDNKNTANGDYYRFYSLFDIAPNAKKQYLWTDWKKTSPGLDISLPMLKVNIVFYIRKLLNILPHDIEEINKIKEIHEKICEQFGDCISVDDILFIIQKAIYIDKYLRDYYEKILKITKCKAISLITYYDFMHYPLFGVAKRYGIPIIEFQHGCIANHYSYCITDDNKNVRVPDYFLTFGPAQEDFTRLLPRTTVVPVGFHFHNIQLSETENILTDNKLIIVYPESCAGFEECIDDLIKNVTPDGYKVAMKLHPLEVSYYEKAYPILSSNKNLIIYTNEFNNNIYHYLKMARHHIVINTTVGLQAASFAHTNICVCTLKRHDTNKCLIENGAARGFKNAAELIDLIRYPMKHGKEYSEQLFMKNAKENIVNFFENILKEPQNK